MIKKIISLVILTVSGSIYADTKIEDFVNPDTISDQRFSNLIEQITAPIYSDSKSSSEQIYFTNSNDTNWLLRQDPAKDPSGSQQIAEAMGYIPDITLSESKQTGAETEVSMINTAEAKFSVNGISYLAIGYSNGNVVIVELDKEGLPKVNNGCDKKQLHEGIRDGSCKVSKKVIDRTIFLSEQNKVPVTSLAYVPIVKNGEISDTEGELFIGFANSRDTTTTIKLTSGILPLSQTSIEHIPGVLFAQPITSVDNPKPDMAHIDTKGRATLAKLSAENGRGGFSIKSNDVTDDDGYYHLGITNITTISVKDPKDGSLSRALVIDGEGKGDRAYTSFGMNFVNIPGIPVPIPAPSVDTIKDAFSSKEKSYSGKAIYYSRHGEQLHIVEAGSKTDEKSAVKDNVSELIMDKQILFGRKDGTIRVAFYNTTLDTASFSKLSYSDEDGTDREVNIDGKPIKYLGYDYQLKSLIISNIEGHIRVIHYENDELLKQESFQDYIPDDEIAYPTASFSSRGILYLILNTGSVLAISLDSDKNISINKIIDKNKAFANIYSAELSDDKQYLVMTNAKGVDLYNLNTDINTGIIDLNKVNLSEAYDLYKLNGFKNRKIVTANFSYGNETTYLGGQYERLVPNGVVITTLPSFYRKEAFMDFESNTPTTYTLVTPALKLF